MATGTIKKMPGKTLLWTNSAPLSQFSAQTVSVNLNGYDLVLIEYSQDNLNNDYYYSFVFEIDGKQHMAIGFYSGRLTRRFTTTNSSGISFAAGQEAATYGGSFSNLDGRLIPIHIFGIKL